MVKTMFRICILDDDFDFSKELHKILTQYLASHKISSEIDLYQNSAVFLKKAASGQLSYQLYFLDILMPGATGIQVAKEIRKYDKTAHIIFLTSSTEYAIDGYEVRAFDYLKKPLDTERLSRTLSELLGTHEKPSAKWLQLKVNGVLKNIPYNNICYIEARRNKLLVVQNDGEQLEFYGTFASILELLKEEPEFTQTHRSFIINMRYIREFSSSNITLQSGHQIPVSRNFSQSAKQDYFEFAKIFFS